MSTRFLLLILTVIFPGCTVNNLDSKEIALSKIKAMNEHNLQALGDLYADSARIESLGFDKVEIGPDGIRGVYRRYFESTPDLTFNLIRLTQDKSSMVLEYTSSGTMTQSKLEGVIPAYFIGKKYTLYNATRIDFLHGKIIAEKTYFDQLSFLRQMGYFEPHE